MMPIFVRGGRLLFAVLLFAAVAFSQEVSAGVTGAITDPSGAAIPGASVTARDWSTARSGPRQQRRGHLRLPPR